MSPLNLGATLIFFDKFSALTSLCVSWKTSISSYGIFLFNFTENLTQSKSESAHLGFFLDDSTKNLKQVEKRQSYCDR